MGTGAFNLFLNDMELGLDRKVAKYAEDTKRFSILKPKAEHERLQKDLSKLSGLATKWKMQFIVKQWRS